VQRLGDASVTKIVPLNRAIASKAGEKLVLHQSTKISGISTLVDRTKVGWIDKAAAGAQLETFEVTTSTVSAEIASNRLAAVDLLKIDVEGYFMEVLRGIDPPDFEKIKNIVAEVDYLPETGIKADELENLLKGRGYTTDCLDRSKANNLTFYAWRA
jgi:FkbM family methyltransferase